MTHSRLHLFSKGLLQTLLVVIQSFWAVPLLASSTIPSDLTSLSLEELMEIEVTSVTKHPEDLKNAADAISVITKEDISRSGATSIVEVLRKVPDMYVSRLGSNQWTVSIRGTSSSLTNKLLVLMDGRTLYTPLFSKVFWERQDTVLDDIERIEIVRSSAESLWGIDAVNGVINIITKKAWKTQGGFVSVLTGNVDKTIIAAHHGGTIKGKAFYPYYVKGKDNDASADLKGRAQEDDREMFQRGFLLRGELDDMSMHTYQTDQKIIPRYSVSQDTEEDRLDENIITQGIRPELPGNSWEFQSYYDTVKQSNDISHFDWQVDIFDLNLKQNFSLNSWQRCTWGLGYRLYRTQVDNRENIVSRHKTIDTNVLNAFFRDEISLVTDRLFLTLSSKFEHNEETDFEIKPSTRLLWKINDQNTIWTAFSQSVRTSSQIDLYANDRNTQSQAIVKTPILMQMLSNNDLDSEDLLAFDIGYRTMPTDYLILDITGFINQYDNLNSFGVTDPFSLRAYPKSHIGITKKNNDLEGDVNGIETNVEWKATDFWKLHCAYTYTRMSFDNKTEQQLLLGTESTSSHHMFTLLSELDITRSVDLDVWLRYIDNLTGLDVPSYITCDLRLGWRPCPNLELSLVGQNLFDPHHLETISTAPVRYGQAEFERSVYGEITWQF